MRSALLAILISGAIAACGGASTSPTPIPAPAPTPTPFTLSGTLTAVNGGQTIAGASIEPSGSAGTTTSSAGAFSVVLPATSAAPLLFTLQGVGLVPHRTYVAPGTRTVTLTAIADSGGFDLGFYRQFVRNALDGGDRIEPLRRWTRSPQIYLRTIDDAGVAIDAATLNVTERAVRETAPLWTAGQFGVDVERGVDTRAGVAGWITVTWAAVAEPGVCGRADVGREGGVIALNARTGGLCRCAGVSEIRPRSVRHELGHALGYWHTDNVNDLMSNGLFGGCDQAPSARERYHAAIAYARPVGNLDPDDDPASAVTLAPTRRVE